MASNLPANLDVSNIDLDQDIGCNLGANKADSLAYNKQAQLEYLDQCLTWSKSEDRGLLAVKFRDNSLIIDNIIERPSPDLQISKKLLQIFTSNTIIKPSKSSKEIFKRILISLFDNNFFEPNGAISSLIENTIYKISLLKTREEKELKREVGTLSDITNLFEVLINRLPDNQHLLLTCITQLMTSTQDTKIISKELKDRIKRLSALMDKFRGKETDFSTSKDKISIQNVHKIQTKEQINLDTSFKQKSSQEQMKISCNNITNDEQEKIPENSVVSSKLISPNKKLSEINPPTSDLTLKRHILPRTRSDLAPKKYKRKDDTPHSFPSPESYVESMFGDLREEALFPIRRTIRRYFSKHSDPKFKNSLFIYENVRFVGIICSEKEGVMFNITFTPVGVQDLSRYRWGNSSRLRYGSLLVIFTKRRNSKYFDRLYFATVARRDARILSKLSISIRFESSIPPGFDPRLEYFMIESKNYRFFHLHQCLSALQTMDHRAIPLTEALLSQSLSSLKQTTFLDMATSEMDQSKIDFSRKAAITFALSNKISLFEMPTVDEINISKILTRTLLINRHKIEQSLPITPTCHVNEDITMEHLKELNKRQRVALDFKLYAALCFSPVLIIHPDRESMDLFLEALLDFNDNFIRLFSRNSPKPHLASRSFYDVANRLLKKYDLPSEIRKFKSNLNACKKTLSEKKQLLRQYSRGYFDRSLLTQPDIKCLATPEHYESLFNSKSSFLKPPNTLTIKHWLYNVNTSLHNFEQSCDHVAESQYFHINYQETIDDTDGGNLDDDADHIYEEALTSGEVAYSNCSDGSEGMEFSNYSDMNSEFDEGEMSSDSEDGDLDDFFDEIVQENSDSENLNFHDKKDVWELNFSEKKDLYDLWESKHRLQLLEDITNISKEIKTLINQINLTRVEMDIFVMKNSSLIATTPEEAIKFHLQLRGVKPRILIIHDTCRLRESQLLPLLPESLKHLVLFNSQDQLSSKYLEVIRGKSIFQRLTQIGYEPFLSSPKHTLTLRPEIASLTNSYRPIESNPSLPNVRGVAKNVFFLTTISQERKVDNKNGTEYANEQEASFLIQFAKYLLKQGYSENDICIATVYSAQIKLIYSLLSKAKPGNQMNLSLITPSSNPRSKIALISLVRSNRDSEIGVLSNGDVVYAAFTIASEGLYVIGDADCIQASNRPKIWDIIFNELRDSLGKKLPLSCQTHHNVTLVAKDKDFRKARNGGCLTPCNVELECGHKCLQICHPDPHSGSGCSLCPGNRHASSQHVGAQLHLIQNNASATPVEAVDEDLW